MSSSVVELAGVDVDALAGDRTRERRGEEHDDVGDLVGLGQTAQVERGRGLVVDLLCGDAPLLGQVVDPNREVDPSFWQWNVTTKKGETLVGIIAGENATSLTLRSPAGDVEGRATSRPARTASSASRTQAAFCAGSSWSPSGAPW